MVRKHEIGLFFLVNMVEYVCLMGLDEDKVVNPATPAEMRNQDDAREDMELAKHSPKPPVV